MRKSARHPQTISIFCILAAGLAAAVPSARAQPAPDAVVQAPPEAQLAGAVADEVVVTGRYRVGPEVRRLAAPVSYRDLDLTTDAGRDVLRQRVRATAQDLCRRLGEANMGSTLAQPSCERDAINSAAADEQRAFAQATPRVYAEGPPPPPPPEAPAAASYAQPAATFTTRTITNGPVPDTPENRARFGGPNSHGGRRTTPAGN
jgi:UrcA family protein